MGIDEMILLVSLVFIFIIYGNLQRSNSKNVLHKGFLKVCWLICVHIIGLLSQLLFSDTSIKPIYFDYITYISGVFLPVVFLEIAVNMKNSRNNKSIWYLYILPIISLAILWTSDWHELFYVQYSTNINEVVFGPYLYIHTIYSYTLLIIAFAIILKYSIKKSGFLSWQTALILLGELAPLITNTLGTFKIVPMSIYITPMMFTVTAVCFYIAIIKLKALNIVPVTLKAIIDNMSDSFVVVSDDGTIADLNQTFVENFKYFGYVKDKDNLYDWMKDKGFVDIKQVKRDVEEAREKGETITKEYHIEKDVYDKYFEVDYQPIKSKDGEEYVATLILLRDVTTLKKDTEIMLKNESLVMLGELAGGVAHDINTPISAIKSGLLILKETVKTDDEKMLVERMDSCANKIVTLTNSLRNQIRNIGSDEVTDVNVTTVITDMATIIHNDLTKHKVKLNLDIKENIIVKGNAAKLSQVVTNIVINAIQAYNDKGGEVNLSVYNEGNNSVIAIEDFAGGIPEHIKDNIGKNILTTKGVSGTGFGLYLAYSVIKGAFGGEITFDTELNKGTTFYITIPR